MLFSSRESWFCLWQAAGLVQEQTQTPHHQALASVRLVCIQQALPPGVYSFRTPAGHLGSLPSPTLLGTLWTLSFPPSPHASVESCAEEPPLSPLLDWQLPEEEKQDNLRLTSLGSPVCSHLEPRSPVPYQLDSFSGSHREGLLKISSPIIARSGTLAHVSVVHLRTLLFRF